MDRTKLETYRDEVIMELTGDILPFWMNNVIDSGSGGFNGAISGYGAVDPAADKSAVMAARILWTFSRAFMTTKNPLYLKTSGLMFNYMSEHFFDKEFGGVYWMLDSGGKPLDTVKKLYSQGFALFGLAEYAKTSGNKQAMDKAGELFKLCERYGRDKRSGGYIDALGRGWEKIEDMRLSPKELNTPKSMNTNLHIMEAYSELAMNYKNKAVMEALESVVRIFLGKIIRPNRHFGLFFDMDWNPESDPRILRP